MGGLLRLSKFICFDYRSSASSIIDEELDQPNQIKQISSEKEPACRRAILSSSKEGAAPTGRRTIVLRRKFGLLVWRASKRRAGLVRRVRVFDKTQLRPPATRLPRKPPFGHPFVECEDRRPENFPSFLVGRAERTGEGFTESLGEGEPQALGWNFSSVAHESSGAGAIGVTP